MMRSRHSLSGVLVLRLALGPRLYLQAIWDNVPAQVAIHFNGAQHADHFTGRAWLLELAWLPTVAYCALTLVPQVHRRPLFWRSPRQRQLRAVVVSALTVMISCLIYASIFTR